MLKSTLTSVRFLFVLSLLTGALYPAVVTLCGQLFFSSAANGSLIRVKNQVAGSRLIAQKFESSRYFQSRPSAADYGTLPSGASNLGPTSGALKEAMDLRRTNWGDEAPLDLLTTSGSGLDPDISPASAYFQLERVAQARGLTHEQALKVKDVISKSIEAPTFGFIGAARVNVLSLNMALDHHE